MSQQPAHTRSQLLLAWNRYPTVFNIMWMKCTLSPYKDPPYNYNVESLYEVWVRHHKTLSPETPPTERTQQAERLTWQELFPDDRFGENPLKLVSQGDKIHHEMDGVKTEGDDAKEEVKEDDRDNGMKTEGDDAKREVKEEDEGDGVKTDGDAVKREFKEEDEGDEGDDVKNEVKEQNAGDSVQTKVEKEEDGDGVNL